MYDTLVLSGNSTNAVVILGALQRLYDAKIIYADDIVNYVATSSGSIISVLLAVGYTPLDVLCYVCVERPYDRMRCMNVGNLILRGKSLTSIEPLRSIVGDMVKDKCGGRIPTLREMYARNRKKLVFVSYDLTRDEKVYVGADNLRFRDLNIVEAAMMSCSFPFIFEPYQFDGSAFVDGGIVDNFPLDYARKELVGGDVESAGSVIGVYIQNPMKPYSSDAGNIALFTRLFQIFVNETTESKIRGAEKITNERTTVIRVETKPNFFNFDQNNPEILAMFDAGYASVKKKSL